jgi:hypothetical protein
MPCLLHILQSFIDYGRIEREVRQLILEVSSSDATVVCLNDLLIDELVFLIHLNEMAKRGIIEIFVLNLPLIILRG